MRGAVEPIAREHRLAGRPLSPATLHSTRCTLHAALNAAIREGILIERIPGTHRYQVTDRGLQIAIFLSRVHTPSAAVGPRRPTRRRP